ncbi:MAG: hypothetical protein NC899_07650, partial [Candidatus Omnitrophica bacterium]|nr:hypothetical protein [Candidatus Omnitrophota bacterium]
IKLGGPIYYNGKKLIKEYLCDKDRKVEISDIDEALKISFLSSFIFLLLGIFLKYGKFFSWW